jgi:hypothetical protein
MMRIVLYAFGFPFFLAALFMALRITANGSQSFGWSLGEFLGVLTLFYPVFIIPGVVLGAADHFLRRIWVVVPLAAVLSGVGAWWTGAHGWMIGYPTGFGAVSALICWLIAKRITRAA